MADEDERNQHDRRAAFDRRMAHVDEATEHGWADVERLFDELDIDLGPLLRGKLHGILYRVAGAAYDAAAADVASLLTAINAQKSQLWIWRQWHARGGDVLDDAPLFDVTLDDGDTTTLAGVLKDMHAAIDEWRRFFEAVRDWFGAAPVAKPPPDDWDG